MVVTGDQRLLDELVRLCGTAGVVPEVAFESPPHPHSWRTAPLVLVGGDAADRLRRVPRRGGVLLVSTDMDDQRVWNRAGAVGAEQVLMLPDAEERLVDAVADAAEGVERRATVVGVAGGSGGVGASTLACALAAAAVRAGQPALLIDADPLGGGLDLLLGAEHLPGLRWPRLGVARGRIDAGALGRALPGPHGIRLLSFDRSAAAPPGPAAMAAVVAAARRRGGLVVIDLPRRGDAATLEALARVDVGLLLVRARPRAVAAARPVASSTGMLVRDLRAVVLGGPGAAPARSLGLPLAGELGPERGLTEGRGRGEPPGGRPGPLAAFVDGFVARVLGAAADGAPDGAAR
ncbi:hypothetical protein BIV57_08710 [Mangrovactinospora gilvigrisea]|uniref:Septum formation initiator n=1 Tax=Mangrovactinospora gilvigrisea TaxID=1428644 RepID=A0A1J7C8L1_9ACTN|nr:hypothetical protein BIV57_08710 [Mangrovactinospora gilvigrisea]